MAVVLTLSAACSSGGDDTLALAPTGGEATVSANAAPPPSTPAPAPASKSNRSESQVMVSAAATEVRAVDSGAAGSVAALEQRLDQLHYEVGDVDGVFDQNTAYGVTAFQKVHGMERNGEATPQLMAAVNSNSTSPPPLVPDGGPTRVEIDLDRQVLFLYENGSLSRILPVSTGNGKRFCSQGRCRVAGTPTGAFSVYRSGSGWETGPLGSLYNPQYIVGGIAIHGSRSVPAYPASHGCIRIPMGAAEWFPSRVTIGTPVFITGDGPALAPEAPASSSSSGATSSAPAQDPSADLGYTPITFTPRSG